MTLLNILLMVFILLLIICIIGLKLRHKTIIDQQTQAIQDGQTLNQELQQHIDTQNETIRHLEQSKNQLDIQLTAAQTRLQERDERYQALQEQLNESKAILGKEFENLANRIFENKSKEMNHHNDLQITQLLRPFREQVDQFQKRMNDIHDASLKGNAALNQEIQHLVKFGTKMNEEAQNLTQALKGKSQVRGLWGEMQLSKALEESGLQKGVTYSEQDSFQHNGHTLRTDFLIRLPQRKCLIIDSKVQLISYLRYFEAAEHEKEACLSEFIKAIKTHIDDLSRKDYQSIPDLDTPSYVLMYLPIESAYIEALSQDASIFQYGLDRNVVIVSRSTLLPILRTVSSVWTLAQNKDLIADLSKTANDMFDTVYRLSERLNKLGSSIKTLTKGYNDTITAVVGKQGLQTKIQQFQRLSSRVQKDFIELNEIEDNLDTAKLETFIDELP
ncbi:DNA recombination protein RmuC [Basilea psittacipulmonis]|uniref:DNA recombination protein RmuC n=1 Tax=Basilea psittacipulmonis TaxID=1472345 RepID=UPI00068994E6|nr:DNA recombination protein RmuC [Basilea psittacipulmonis]